MQKTIRYADERGYEYCETAEDWKTACLPLPCFTAVQWPDYATAVIEDVIDGQPVVIQLWKGWCQKFLNDPNFPGGIGAEVGIYHRVPGKVPAADIPALPFLPPQAASFLLDGLARVGGDHLWWPFPELKTTIDWTLVNPRTAEVFFHAGPETTYWMNKWMQPASYERYRQIHTTPTFSVEYELQYRINGKSYVW